jgi:hypothetical protein
LTELDPNGFGNEHMPEQARQNFDRVNQHQVAHRPRVGDDHRRAPSGTKPLKHGEVPLDVFDRARLEYIVSFEKSVDLVASVQAESLRQFIFAQPRRAKALDNQSLQSLSLEIGAARAKSRGDFVGYTEGEVHQFTPVLPLTQTPACATTPPAAAPVP